MAVNELIVTAEFVSNILNEPLEESGGGKVKSVNGMIGDVVLTAEDIGYNDTTIADALDNLADELENKAAIIVSSASGAIASFPDGAAGTVKSLVAQIEPKQSGSGDPSPTNIRPISGWTGAEGKRTGINVWDEEWENGYYNRATGAKDGNGNTTYFRSKNYIPCAPNTSYYFKAPSVHASNATYYAVLFYGADKSYISSINSGIGNTARTTPQNAHFMTLYIEVGTSGATYQNDISVNYPSTATEYNAYTASTISVTFPDSAGTVYGGTLDVTNGVLTVDRAKITLNGTQNASITNWRPTSTSVGAVFPYNLTNNKIYQSDGLLPNIRSNYLKPITYAAVYQGTSDAAVTTLATTGTSAYGICIRIPDTSVTTQQQLMTYLAANPLDVVYELATPQTYQFTPQEVTTLLGANNIWFDTGDTSVEYPADTKLYIDKVINAAIAAL